MHPPPAGRPRVARVIARLNIGGPAIQAVSLSRHLGSAGYTTLLLHGRLSPGEGDMGYLLTPETAVRIVPTLGREMAPVRDLRAWWCLYRTLCQFRPRIVHTHTAKAGALGRLAAIAYNHTAGRREPARLVHTYHGHVFDGYFGRASTRFFVAVERWLARRTDALVAISPRIREDLLDTYSIATASQIHVIPLGFDLSPFAAIDDAARERARAALRITPGRRVVTTVGRLTAIKQHSLFLEMAQELTRHVPETEYLLVGDGELRAGLEAQTRACGLAGRVRFLGWQRDLATIYGATDVFVLTSRNEGTPVALIEAMASGVPGVSTDVGGVRDVIVDPGVGVVVPFGEPRALALAVQDLLASADRRRVVGEQARAAVLQRFHLDRLLSDIAGLYNSLQNTPPCASASVDDAR